MTTKKGAQGKKDTPRKTPPSTLQRPTSSPRNLTEKNQREKGVGVTSVEKRQPSKSKGVRELRNKGLQT